MNNNIEPQQQADGYSLDEMVTVEQELVEELADSILIGKLLDTFIGEIGVMLNEVVATSVEGNPVRTHLVLEICAQDVLVLAHELKQELIFKVANRAEAITEESGLGGATPISPATHASELRKQVIPDEIPDEEN